MMNYNIKGTGIEVTPELRAYAEKQLERVEKFTAEDPSAHADVECEHAPLNDGGKYRAEFTVSSGGDVFRAEDWGSTMHEALDVAGNELFRELRRAKRKRLHVFRSSAVRVKEYLRGWRNKV
jgi:putative sigma-54 modulation protein